VERRGLCGGLVYICSPDLLRNLSNSSSTTRGCIVWSYSWLCHAWKGREGSRAGDALQGREGSTAGHALHGREGKAVQLVMPCREGKAVQLVMPCRDGKAVQQVVPCREGTAVQLVMPCTEGKAVQLVMPWMEATQFHWLDAVGTGAGFAVILHGFRLGRNGESGVGIPNLGTRLAYFCR
jgi:hypothetical protein